MFKKQLITGLLIASYSSGVLFAFSVIPALADPSSQPSDQTATVALLPGTFITASGTYRWHNAAAKGELTFRNNQLRSITLGISPEPPPGTTILDSWTNAPSESKLVISDHEISAIASDGHLNSSIGINTWHPSAHWFVYRANGMRLWVCDGHRGLWMLTLTPHGSESSSLSSIEEKPPTAVLDKLPPDLKKMFEDMFSK